MAKPWIGIPTRFQDEHTTGKIRLYLEPVLWAGGLPVMIPTFSGPDVGGNTWIRLDGILLPGSSSDIDPALYGQTPRPRLGKRDPDRDELDLPCWSIRQGRLAGAWDLFWRPESERIPGRYAHQEFRRSCLLRCSTTTMVNPEPARRPVRLGDGGRSWDGWRARRWLR